MGWSDQKNEKDSLGKAGRTDPKKQEEPTPKNGKV